jgi:hypothetical protein
MISIAAASTDPCLRRLFATAPDMSVTTAMIDMFIASAKLTHHRAKPRKAEKDWQNEDGGSPIFRFVEQNYDDGNHDQANQRNSDQDLR